MQVMSRATGAETNEAERWLAANDPEHAQQSKLRRVPATDALMRALTQETKYTAAVRDPSLTHALFDCDGEVEGCYRTLPAPTEMD